MQGEMHGLVRKTKKWELMFKWNNQEEFEKESKKSRQLAMSRGLMNGKYDDFIVKNLKLRR